MGKNNQVIHLKAGEKIKLYSRSFSSVPMVYEFTAKATGATALSGLIEIETRQTLFRKPIKQLELSPSNTVKATIWDTFVTIYVTAYNDLEVSLPKRRMGSKKLILGVALLLVAMASGILIFTAH